MPGTRLGGSFRLGGELEVNRVGLGSLSLVGPGSVGPPSDPAACRRVLRRALELGVDLIDTADAYGAGSAEELIAETLHPYPAGLVIATKGGVVMTSPGHWHHDGSPAGLRSALEASLRRLRLDCIDLYHYHRVDPAVPFEESVGALSRLREEGKVRLLGLSNVTPAQLAAAVAITPIASVQNRFNLTDRGAESMVRVCARAGVAFLPYAPTKLSRGGVGAVGVVAARLGVSVHQVALAWLLAFSANLLPIPGTSSVAHLEENVAAAAVELGQADLGWLSKEVPSIEPQTERDLIYGTSAR